MYQKNQPLVNYCEPKILGISILPFLRSFEESRLACKQLKSDMHIYTDTVSKTFEKIDNLPNERYWSGFVFDEGHYTASTNDNIILNHTKLTWKWGEPNGFELEQCISIMNNSTNLLNDDNCYRKIITTCNIQKILMIKVHIAERSQSKILENMNPNLALSSLRVLSLEATVEKK